MKPVIVIDDVANADSTMDNDDGCRKFMVNTVSEHSLTMSEDIDVPILCLDDDDDDDDDDNLKIESDYKLFLDYLSDDNNVVPPFEDDNGESETRNLNDSNRSKLGGTEKPIKNRVSQQRKRKTIGFESEVPRAFTLATTRESIQRNNRVAERRKRKIAELEATRSVPLVRNQVNIQRDNKARKMSELTNVETLWDVPLVRTLEDIKRDNKARKLSKSKVDTSWDVPLVRTLEVIQRDNKARRLAMSKVDTSWDVPLVRAKEVIKRDNKARKVSGSKVDTSWDVPLVRTLEVMKRGNENRKTSGSKVDTLWDVPLVKAKELIQRDNRVSERRKKNIGETKASGTSKVVPVERVNRGTEPKAVEETTRFVPVTQSNNGVFVGTREKNVEESVAVVDNDYKSYLTWLVDSFKDQTTEPDPSDIDPPNLETQKESTTVPENNHLLAKVKVELESRSDDDDDIIAVSDSPFLDGESTPFVVSKSKNVIDLEKDNTEDESGGCVFKKELMNVLKKPYDEGELLLLSRQASMKKRVSRCRELRKGRERSYETSKLGLSYLEKVSDFDEKYKRVDGDDKTRLELLRGFFFYLENISLPGAFKPWLPDNRGKLGQRKQP